MVAWINKGTPLVAMVVLLAGCGAESVSTRDAAAPGIGQDLLGSWYPWDIPGYASDEFGLQTFKDAVVTFKDDGTWTGSDGCNGQGGTYTITAAGGFASSKPGIETAMGCANVPNARVLASSTSVELVDDVLTFKTKWTTAGRYVRTPQAKPSPTP